MMQLTEEQFKQYALSIGADSEGPIQAVVADAIVRARLRSNRGYWYSRIGIASGFKWPNPGEWINYRPPLILEDRRQRTADTQERELARYLRNVWKFVTEAYLLRLPLTTAHFRDVADLRQTQYLHANINGNCMGDFLPHGSTMLTDTRVPCTSGDLVVVEWSEADQALLDYHGQKLAPDWYQQTYGGTGNIALKVYFQIDGREILMNAKQAQLKGDSRIIGVIRNVQIDGKPMYGSRLAVNVQPRIGNE